MNITVPTEDAARVRRDAGTNPWNSIYAMVYLFGVIAFIAISVYENAWQYRSVTESNLIALAWTAPLPVAAHLTQFITSRGRRTRTTRTLDRVIDQVNTAAAEAGLPRLQQDALRRMLTTKDNGPQPYTGAGKFPYEPMLTWELPTDDPAVLITATRSGAPEVITLEWTAPGPQQVDGVGGTVTVLGAYPHTTEAPITASRLGGQPAAPSEFTWPTCAEHGTPMQFLAQLEHEEQLLLVFLCTTDPGSCESWDPDAGCNAVIPVTGRDLHLAEPPIADAVIVQPPLLLGVRSYQADSPLDAFRAAASDGITVAGLYGGAPDWIQSDETPAAAPMFVASLDEEPMGFNFGSAGIAYIFTDGAGAAKLVLQS